MNSYEKCKDLLEDKNIDIKSNIDFDVNGELHVLSFEYILGLFMQTDKKDVFYQALEQASLKGEDGIKSYFEMMGQLFLMSHLSDKLV